MKLNLLYGVPASTSWLELLQSIKMYALAKGMYAGYFAWLEPLAVPDQADQRGSLRFCMLR